jgi:hypothetical protein
MMVATAQALIDEGFGIEMPPGGQCTCGHAYGQHRFEVSFGDPLMGGLTHCQEYPACPCTGTWNTSGS